MKISRLLVTSILLLVTGGVVAAQPANFCATHPCIQVGSFNIEWFGTTDTSKHAHRSPKTVKQIANFIADTLDLEVFALEEINVESEEFGWLREALAPKGYQLRSVGTSGGEQRVVIGFDADEVTLLNDSGGDGVREMNVRSNIDLGNNCRSSNMRLPLYGRFRAGQFDFVFVGVHLKSQRQVDGAPNPAQCADDVRRAQAQDLVTALPQLIQTLDEQDVIIAGDFNASLTDASLNPFFANGGFTSLTRNASRAAGSNSISYLKTPYQEIIDHVLIRTPQTTEWVTRSTFIYNPPSNPSNYLKFFSDHAPAWTSFRTDVGN